MSRKVPQSVKTNRKVDFAVKEALQIQSARYAKAAIAQADQYNQEIEQLKQAIPKTDGFLVYNWKQGWKWFSNWSLAGIVYVSMAGVPQEVIELFPLATQSKVTQILALIGFVGRFINQSESYLKIIKQFIRRLKNKDDANV